MPRGRKTTTSPVGKVAMGISQGQVAPSDGLGRGQFWPGNVQPRIFPGKERGSEKENDEKYLSHLGLESGSR